ncbi:hypothetical protein [Paraburkholderia sediminicola]|uniref:hypothetical protein n=1 Tax=Paraburkholderia sediminicola TaxID=458836 RepID=UPI001FEACF02|nr:hypothetical protein [Paraburkholderia sediminicola]
MARILFHLFHWEARSAPHAIHGIVQYRAKTRNFVQTGEMLSDGHHAHIAKKTVDP